jgi:hypothetical protein
LSLRLGVNGAICHNGVETNRFPAITLLPRRGSVFRQITPFSAWADEIVTNRPAAATCGVKIEKPAAVVLRLPGVPRLQEIASHRLQTPPV